MRRTLARACWVAAVPVAAACGGQAGTDLFGSQGGAGGASDGGSLTATGGSVGTGGGGGTGGTAAGSGGAGQPATGGTGGASSAAGGSAGTPSAGGASGGVTSMGGVSSSAGNGGASNSAGKGGTAGAAGKGGAGSAGKGGGSAGKGGGSAGKGGGANSGGAAGSAGSSNAGAGGKANCDALRAQLPSLLTAAQVCDNSLGREPCAGFVSDECGCKVPVDAPSLPVAQSYVNAVTAVANCAVPCLAIVCPEPVSARCQTESGQALGRCVAQAP